MLAQVAEAATAVDMTEFTTALTSSITPAQVLAIIGAVVGVGMTFFLMWLGVRKAVRSFSTAVKTGNIRL